jgi:hypothetical protein
MRTEVGQLANVQIGYQTRGKIERADGSRHRILALSDLEGGDPAWDQLTPFVPMRDPDLYTIRSGDILYACRGRRFFAHYVENCPEGILAANTLYIVTVKPGTVLPGYLTWWLNSEATHRQLRKISQGTDIPQVPKKHFMALEVDVPPLETQEMIVAVDALASKERQLSDKLTRQRKLLADALSLRAATAAL